MLNHLTYIENFIAAAIGAAVAIMIDTATALERSVIFDFVDFVETRFSSALSLSPHVIAAAFVSIGALSIFYFRPLSRKGAFACGFASVALVAFMLP